MQFNHSDDRRPVSAAGNGFSLVSFLREGSDVSAGQLAEMLSLPLPDDQVCGILQRAAQFRGLNLKNGLEAAKRLTEVCAHHPNQRIRECAAGFAILPEDAVRCLARDPASDVRKSIANNNWALAQLTPDERLELAEDNSIAEDIISGSVYIADNNEFEGGFDQLDAAVIICARLAQSPDPEIQAEAEEALEDLKEIRDSRKEQTDETAPLNRRRRSLAFRLRERSETLLARTKYGYALAWSTDGVPDLNRMIPLESIDLIEEAVQCLTVESGEGWELIKRLARHTAHDVRVKVAELSGMPKAVLELIVDDPSYDIRLELLRNSDALKHMSGKDIVNAVQGDPGLVEWAFGRYGQADEALEKLRSERDHSRDPRVNELIEMIEAEQD